MLFLLLVLFSAFAHANPQHPEGIATEKLRNAETWYHLARLTENDLSAHLLSEKAYKDARQEFAELYAHFLSKH